MSAFWNNFRSWVQQRFGVRGGNEYFFQLDKGHIFWFRMSMVQLSTLFPMLNHIQFLSLLETISSRRGLLLWSIFHFWKIVYGLRIWFWSYSLYIRCTFWQKKLSSLWLCKQCLIVDIGRLGDTLTFSCNCNFLEEQRALLFEIKSFCCDYWWFVPYSAYNYN